MSEEERRLLIRPILRNVILELVTENKIAGQTEDTAELLFAGNTSKDRYGSSLGEATQNNP